MDGKFWVTPIGWSKHWKGRNKADVIHDEVGLAILDALARKQFVRGDSVLPAVIMRLVWVALFSPLFLAFCGD
jgi:hypothetical protein